MEVPERVAKDASVRGDAEKMSVPGAKMSTQLPMLLKLDLWSLLMVMEATVMA